MKPRPVLPLLVLLMSMLGPRPGNAAERTLPLQDSVYELSRGSLKLGVARFSLSPQAEGDCYRYEYVASPSGLASLFIGQLHETSQFCVEQGRLRTRRFEFTRADKAKDNFSVDFDWKAGVVTTSSGYTQPLKDDMTDRLLMQLTVQQWVIARNGEPGPEEFASTKVEEQRLRTCRFRIVSREKVKVPAGEFDTVRVERVDDPKRSTRFWLAPSRGYTAVRVEQIDKGSEQLKMQLRR